MEYMEGMEVLDSDIMDRVLDAMNEYDYSRYTEQNVLAALAHDIRTPEDFAALLSPAAQPYLEAVSYTHLDVYKRQASISLTAIQKT